MTNALNYVTIFTLTTTTLISFFHKGAYSVSITDLRVPPVVKNGTNHAAILDCLYTLSEVELSADSGLVVKWFFNKSPNPVYQWIHNQKPQGLGILKGRLWLDYKASQDNATAYRALYILNPTVELSGEYKCVVSTNDDEDFSVKRMIVYAPEKRFEIFHTRYDLETINITCRALGVYPEPEVHLFNHSTKFYDVSVISTKNSNSYDVIASVLIPDTELSSPTVIECVLNIPNTPHHRRKTMQYYPDVHRGVLLSLSGPQKNAICQDIYGYQLYSLPFAGTDREANNLPGYWVRDSYKKQDPPVQYEHPLTVQKVRELSDPLFDEEALSFKCVGLDFTKRVPLTYNWIHVISAFRPKWFYSTKKPFYKKVKGYHLQDFVTLSPDYVPLKPVSLEERYLNTRKTMIALGRESLEYVELVEKWDNLSNLSKVDKYTLCASTLSSPVYRKDRLEFSLDWMYETIDSGSTLDYEEEVSFKSNPAENKMKTDCILCVASEDVTSENSKSTPLFLTRSYNDEYSVVVLKPERGRIFVDKYFKNIPILMTTGRDVDHGFLTLDFYLRGDKESLSESQILENL